jgi:circadian clock protein KaiB
MPRDERPVSLNTIDLRLYIAGDSPRSRLALHSLQRLLAVDSGYRLEIVDILDQPGRAEEDHILATPTLLRLSPAPRRRIVGDLGPLEHLMRALGTPQPRGEEGSHPAPTEGRGDPRRGDGSRQGGAEAREG